MKDDQLKAVVEKAVADAFERQPEPTVCSLGIDQESHNEEHQFIRSLIGVSNRLDNIRWGFLKKLIDSTGIALVIFICVLLVAWAKAELTKAGG